MEKELEQLKVGVAALEAAWSEYNASEDRLPTASYKAIRSGTKELRDVINNARKTVLVDWNKRVAGRKHRKSAKKNA